MQPSEKLKPGQRFSKLPGARDAQGRCIYTRTGGTGRPSAQLFVRKKVDRVYVYRPCKDSPTNGGGSLVENIRRLWSNADFNKFMSTKTPVEALNVNIASPIQLHEYMLNTPKSSDSSVGFAKSSTMATKATVPSVAFRRFDTSISQPKSVDIPALDACKWLVSMWWLNYMAYDKADPEWWKKHPNRCWDKASLATQIKTFFGTTVAASKKPEAMWVDITRAIGLPGLTEYLNASQQCFSVYEMNYPLLKWDEVSNSFLVKSPVSFRENDMAMEKVTVICFRGTINRNEIKLDLNIMLQNPDTATSSIESEAMKWAQAVLAWDPTRTWHLTGYSLGGVLAVKCGIRNTTLPTWAFSPFTNKSVFTDPESLPPNIITFGLSGDVVYTGFGSVLPEKERYFRGMPAFGLTTRENHNFDCILRTLVLKIIELVNEAAGTGSTLPTPIPPDHLPPLITVDVISRILSNRPSELIGIINGSSEVASQIRELERNAVLTRGGRPKKR